MNGLLLKSFPRVNSQYTIASNIFYLEFLLENGEPFLGGRRRFPLDHSQCRLTAIIETSIRAQDGLWKAKLYFKFTKVSPNCGGWIARSV
jgi:hypothetical protein